MNDIDFMCEMLHIDELLAQMTEEEKLGLVLLFISEWAGTDPGGGIKNEL